MRHCTLQPPTSGAVAWRAVVAQRETREETLVLQPCSERSPVPSAWNFSRFLTVLEKAETETGCVARMMDTLRERLKDALPDFGTHLGCDGEAIESHSTGQVNRKTGKTLDADADWGKHETHGIDQKTGKPWTMVQSWEGYGSRLIADTYYEIPVAAQVTPASNSESVELSAMPPMVARPSRLNRIPQKF